MKQTIIIHDQKSPSIPTCLTGLSSDYILNKVKNKTDLLKTAIRDRPIAIMLFVPSTRSGQKSICRELKDNKDTCQIPVVAIVSKNTHSGEKAWFKCGVEDILYETENPEELAIRIKNRLETSDSLHQYQAQTKSLQKRLRRKTRELIRTQVEIVQRLSMAAEHRDPETGDHIHRMSHYCHCIAEAFGVSEKESRLLLNASPMHDIGKLGIPDSVLLNPQELTQDEWVIMK